MKKYPLLLITILIIVCSICGCRTNAPEDAEQKGDQYFYDEITGKVYTDYSQNFDIKIEQWKYYRDTATSQDRILLSITVKNKTHQELDDFVAAINLNQNAADLVASGILVYDQFAPCDLVPKKTANGASYAIDFLVETDDWLQGVNANKDKLLSDIRYVTLKLSWRTGEETIDLVCDELVKSES